MSRHGSGLVAVALAVVLIATSGCGDSEVASPANPPASTPTLAPTNASTPTPTPTSLPSLQGPTIEGPISGGSGKPFLGSTTFDLAQVGYSEAEYFMSGTATAFTKVGAFAVDGVWSVASGDSAAYKTRLLVYRPIDAKNFNGTVVVEWLNESGGVDAAADWITGHVELTRAGFAWMGVSAQRVGVEGGTSLLGSPTIPLKTIDPARYGSLVHPGDSFSYDIFSQAAQAILRPAGINPLGDLQINTVIAAGDSQSAFRLVTYINAIHPLADIYDGFLVHSRGGNAVAVAPLSETPQAAITVPAATHIRADLNVPVLIFETETDLTFLGYARAQQNDSERIRVWEVAGAAHADTYTTVVGGTDLGSSPDAAALVVTAAPVAGFTPCPGPINSGPQHFVLNAALAALNQWVREGSPPPSAPRLELAAGAAITLVRDANGNALGGIRTPQVDVPIAALSGEPQAGSVFCLLFGSTTPFDDAMLTALYADHAAYVTAFNAATDRAVAAGFILPPDADLMKANAAASSIAK